MLSVRYSILRFLNMCFILVVGCVIIGAYIYQYTTRQLPCPLCELQRLAMIAMTFGPLLNLHHRLDVRHYAITIVSALFGGAVSLRQICLHICPGFPTFGLKVFGFELYTWAFIVFCSSLLTVALFLLLSKSADESIQPNANWAEKTATAFIFLIAIANAITVFGFAG